ncbi:MAG: hypothetical protein IPN52_01320 [Micrococcales bacterium]|nr:hypothetical protein [Micrococcales bacterium]
MSVRLPVIVCVLAIAVLAVGPAAADPVVDGRFAVSGVGTNNQITTGPGRQRVGHAGRDQ